MDFALLTTRLLASRSSSRWVRHHVWDHWYICSAWLNPSIISQPGTSVCHHHLTRPTFLPAMSGEGAARYLTASQWAMYRSPRRFWDSWLPSTLMEHVRRKFAQFLICHQELSKNVGEETKVLDCLEQCTVKDETNRYSPPTNVVVEKSWALISACASEAVVCSDSVGRSFWFQKENYF